MGLRGQELFALTVLAALPPAQNVYVYSVRYRESQVRVRGNSHAQHLLDITIYSIEDLVDMCARVGFERVLAYDSTGCAPAHDDSRVIVMAMT